MAAKCKKHGSIALDLQDFIIVPSKLLHDQLTSTRGYVTGFFKFDSIIRI